MRALQTTALVMLAACGAPDKLIAPDMPAAAVEDLAVTAPPMQQPPDATAPTPADLATPTCTAPQPGIYADGIGYTYTPAGGGTAMSTSNYGVAAIKNDGSIIHPSSTFPSPERFHCTFTSIDPITCMALCCPGQSSSPLLYTDKSGWTMWAAGACLFQTTTGSQWIANVTYAEGYLKF